MDFLKEILSLYWVGGPFYILTCIGAVTLISFFVVHFMHYLEEKEII